MWRRNFTASWLKILWKTLCSVKFYDKSNINVFTLSQWETFWWGVNYFDQFILIVKLRKTKRIITGDHGFKVKGPGLLNDLDCL